jgi:putative proteasome-type protease
MTYGLGILLKEGVVMAADTRINAGVDHIASMRKLHLFQQPNSHVLALASAGNLATTQAVVTLLNQRLGQSGQAGNLFEAPTMFDAARVVGATLREVMAHDARHVEAYGDPTATWLLGGQIGEAPPALMMIYSAGNFIAAADDTPYLQIGENKYGKPILDRTVRFDLSVEEAVKITLLSFDATIRSNIGVAPPIDFFIKRKDRLEPVALHRIATGDAYFTRLRDGYAAALHDALASLPLPDWTGGHGTGR